VNHFISIRDLTAEELHHLLQLAGHVKAAPSSYAYSLKSKSLAMLFEKPSLRTRVTFDLAMEELGGHSLYLGPAEIHLGRRESVHDVAKNLERMVDAIMIRTFAHTTIEQLAAHASVPVINGLSDFSHPCQALADYLTILEVKGRIKGLKVAFVGDGNNVARSLLFAGALLGADVWIATPPGFEMDEASVQWARAQQTASGGSCTMTHSASDAARDADVLYTDVWASMGQESEAAARAELFRGYQVNAELMAYARRDVIFLHCLPAHRGDEVTDEVMDSPRAFVFLQAENRLHTQKAVLLETMAQRPDRMTRRDALQVTAAWAVE
jgi:ornithine carbamoyltransferase